VRRSVFLAWLVAILGILAPSIASAATTANLETRVKAFELGGPTLIGPLRFRQTTASPAFSAESTFAGKNLKTSLRGTLLTRLQAAMPNVGLAIARSST